MLEDWHDFYLLVGGAAGALIGLLFVVASLAGQLHGGNAEKGRPVYLSPTVFHFSLVLGVGALAMAPHIANAIAWPMLLAAAVIGLGYSAAIWCAFIAGEWAEQPHWTDMWFYGVAPTAIYAGMAAAAVDVARAGAPGLYAIAAAQGALMLVGIRNAWDLITWIAPRAQGDQPPAGEA